jgi:8-oxo-dGTP pyrophosphatase MutT (NUDIX family)
MTDSFFSAVEELSVKSFVDKKNLQTFIQQLQFSPLRTRDEGASDHFCSMIAPVHRDTHSIYLVDHIKGKTWMVPGGHIDKQETSKGTALRECKEEIQFSCKEEECTLFNISISPIKSEARGCITHFDFWYILEMSQKVDFLFDRREFADAGWFSYEEAREKITYPPYVKIIQDITEQIL